MLNIANETGLKCLKVKIKSLAAEAKIIRLEENKIMNKASDTYTELYLHRVVSVRMEARAAQLAYAYLKGYKYKDLEDPNTTKKKPDANRVWKLIKRYSDIRHMSLDDKIANVKDFGKWIGVDHIYDRVLQRSLIYID